MPRRRSLAAVTTSVLAAVAGFTLVAAWGRFHTPWPEDFAVTPKLEYVRSHPGEFNAMYFGLSNVFRSFVPRIIDAEVQRAGIPFRSFNFGGPGMTDSEVDHLIRTVLAIDGVDLDYAFVEVPEWHRFTDQNTDTNRATNWHTPRQTWHMLHTLYVGDFTWRERFREARSHLRSLVSRATSLGQGKRIVRNALGGAEPQPITVGEVESERGYQALEGIDDDEIRRRREVFLDHATEYSRRVESLVERNRAPFDLASYNLDALREQIEMLRAAGVEPIYVVPPGLPPAPFAFALRDAGHLPNLLAFNDPERYPELYRFECRFDGHLTRVGAEEFSRIFARAFAESR